MSNIIQGTQYSVVANDFLSTIAGRAYGDIYKWRLIESSNPQLNGRGVASDGSPLIFPGDQLWIPLEVSPEVSGDSFATEQIDSFSLTIGSSLVAVTSGTFIESMDQCADAFTAVIDIDSLDPVTRSLLTPFQFPPAVLRINGVVRLTGYVSDIQNSVSSSGRIKRITGYSNTIDLVDSVVSPPFEESNVTLQARATRQCAALGIIPVFKAGAEELFDKITAKQNQKRFDHLLELSRERGVLISNTASGNLLFHLPTTNLAPIGIITESEIVSETDSIESRANGREVFSSYRVTGKNITGSTVTSTVADATIKRPRFFSKSSRGGLSDVQKSARWERSRALSKALSISVPVNSWRGVTGEVWESNRFLQLTAPSIDISSPVLLLIKSIELVFSPKGKTARLTVVPKEVFSEEPIPQIWS